MIERFSIRRRKLGTARPVRPTPKRELLGVLAFLALIVAIDRFSTYVYYLSLASLIYVAAIVWVAVWGGLRSAVASTVLLVIYAWIVYHYPISAFPRDNKTSANLAVFWTAFFYGLIAVIAGLVQNKLRDAAVREFDARAVADTESQHRRIAEAELWASEEMRRLIVDSSVDAIVGMQSDGTITMWNPNAEKLFGWGQAEAIGVPVNERISPPNPRKTRRSGSPKLLEPGKSPILRTPIEMVAQTKTGEEISIEVYIADHPTDSGQIYIGFIRDISDRKRAELAIQELNARLEERVVERTAQLEAANSELVGFTYSVSHDLRAPLRAIIANSRMVCEEASDALDESTLSRLKRLEHNALKMSELIENLLQFARIGQVALNMRHVDLTSMAQEIGEDLKSMKAGSVSVEEGMTGEGDPEMIKMVLFNLMENAWKYTPVGEVPRVEVGETPDSTFYVRDQGIGFDMQYVDKIWEPFERLHLESEYAGTGIGLANCKRIITRHGGKIWADSAKGEGTTIYFELGGKPSEGDLERRSGYAS